MTTILLLLITIVLTWCCAWGCCLRAVRRVLDEHIEVASFCGDDVLCKALTRIKWTISKSR